MARLESIAVAGYFPTPTHLLSAVADLCEAAEGAHTDAVADPCAGKGEALLALLGAWYPEREPGTLSSGSRATAHVFAAELEGSRYKALETALYSFRGGKGRVQSHRGDAFRLDLGLTDHRPPAGLTCLYLNPPYDHDARFKRLEERFLQRFMPALMTGGVLLFVVPVHALSASLDTLGTWAQDVEVLRFPDPDYAVFKQVVVRARRRPGQLPVADPAVVDALRAAMSDPLGLPTIDAAHTPYTFPVAPMTLDWRNRPQPGEAGIGWKAALLDEGALFATHKAWHQTARNGTLVTAARVFPKTALGSLRARYPMAVPPKPGHVAAAIAAGVFNGETLCADDSTTEAPPIIVKGRFARVWRTTEEKRNMEGETTGHVQVEEPRLEVTALDLRELVFCDLKSSPLPSGSQEPSSMTTGDLLTQYGNGLLTTLRAHCPVLHDPADPSHVIPLVQTARPLYAAQAHAAMACVKLLGGPGVPRARRKGTFAFLIGEVGSGKSCTFLVVARTIGARRTLMVCPPHLLSSWDDEVKAAWPEARVVTLASVNDIDALAAEKAGGGDHRPVVAVLSREGAKLGHGWATVPRCGECGAPAHAGDHAERRSTCLARIPTPTTPDELYASRLMAVMVGHTPALQGKPRCTPMHALRYALDLAVAAGRWATALLIGECFADASARLDVVKRVPVNTEDDLRLLLSVPPETPGWLSEVIRRIGEHDEAGRKSVAVFRAWAAYIHHDKRRPESWNQYGRVYSQDGVLRVEGRTVGTPDALGVVLAALPVVPFRVCGAPLYQAIPSPRRTALATYIARRHPELFDIVGLDECFVAGTRVSGRAIETIRVGDTVRSFDEAAGVFVTRPVTRLYRNPPRALVRVWLSDGRALVCTPGHPFLTPDGWRAAGALTSADIVRTTGDDQGEEGMDGAVRALRRTPDVDGWRDARSEQRTAEGPRLLQPGVHERGARGVEPGRNAREASGGSGTTEAMGGVVSNVHDPVHPDRGSGVHGEDAGVRLLLSGLHEGNAQPADRGCDGALLNPGCGPDRCEDERPEPDGGPERASAHGGYAATDRAPPARAGGQRPGADGAATTASGSPRLGDGGPDRDGFAPSPGASDALHARHRGPGPEDRGGGRRGLAHGACGEAPGRSEGRLPPWVGVDRVEVLEPGSDGTYGGLCPDGLVYNLEVEGTHTYDAEGVVVHNCHELSGEGSAQERAAHRITGTRAPTVLLTGSILNGYAAHLFPHLWALDPKFREAFKRDDRGKFAKQYGYRRRFVAEPTGGKASKRGKVTDRVEGAVRDMGESPGVQPTAILHWLLPHAVTLHKGDLEVHIPPLTITRVAIHPTEEMASRHKAALVDLMRQIKEDRFTDMAGALWGQLTLAPSHLDRMTVDVCGSPDGAWTVAYPEHRGGAVVHRGECFPADTVLPKERWMLDELQRQIARGRATIVLSHHVELMPRYARLIREHLKLKVSVLDANKVSPAKRKAWIQAQNAAGAQVLLTNPVAIGTGLNVLVFYATELWMENPGCNAITFRQAVGRIDRIGQTKPTEVYFPVYEDTIQGPAHTLLLQKVAVSQSTDGLDARSALQAAGVGDAPDVSALSIGKLLFDLLDKSADLRRAIAAATPRTR